MGWTTSTVIGTVALTVISGGALAGGGSTLYRMEAGSAYQQGCFDPCDCPLSEPVSVRGLMRLGPPVPGNAVDFHEVSDLKWRVVNGDELLHTVTGGGTYRVTNFGPPLQHALDLSLSIDGGEVQQFFSDLQPLDSTQDTIDLAISLNGFFCKDTAFYVNSAPVPAEEQVRYRLQPGSTWQQGCFDPCDCPLEAPRPMRGGFTLVNLFDTGTYAEYAMLAARFSVPGGPQGARTLRFAGNGQYELIQGFAGPAHTMTLNTRSRATGPLVFDSALENTQTLFPLIDIRVDTNDSVCFDRVMELRAAPIAVP